MAEYSYIHIALRGPVQGATRTIYSYPEGDTAETGWDTAMVEPGAAVKRFLNATECYVLQTSPQGHYISLITRDSDDATRWLMVSVMVDNGCSLTGRQVLALLGNLKKTLVDDGDLRDEAVDVALIESQVPRLPVKLRSWGCDTLADGEQADGAEAGYRTYISTQELEQIFAFPSQPEYARFRCVLVVSATTSLRPGVKMPRITVPVRKQYTVECPEGVTASRTLVYDGDKLVLTYAKEGYDSHTETVTVGQPSAYTKIDGPVMHVRTAAQTGIRFVRRVRVKVVSSKGGVLRGYTITLNGRLINTMTPYIDFTPRDLPEGEDVDIRVESNNYHTLKLKVPSAEILTTDELTLELSPVEQTVTLRLDFGDGRVFSQEITIEKNTAEYNRLHSGNFHGFRAHRQITSDNTEVYNVDVRLTNPPVAPNFETGRETAATEGESRPRSPKFDNVADENVDRRPHIDTTLPTAEPETPADDPDYDDDETSASVPFIQRKVIRLMFVGAVAVLAVVLAAIFWPETGGNPVASDAAADSIAAEVTATQPAPVPTATPEEQADIDYLNGNAAWNLDRLKSPMGQALAAAMREGDLNALAQNDYFAVRGRCTNTQATQIVDMAWTAIGSPNARGNSRRLAEAAKKGDIDLHKLVESMAKVRPSENQNTSPRPQR